MAGEPASANAAGAAPSRSAPAVAAETAAQRMRRIRFMSGAPRRRRNGQVATRTRSDGPSATSLQNKIM
ncbi:hypothetical protein XF35_41605 [Streptomyces platensis subsp. clarensis]|nr:hypothetical protein [Streptomyces platensis subsp. clarensis]